MIGLAYIGQVVTDFDRQPWSRIGFNLVVDSHAVLVPRNTPVLIPDIVAWCYVQVGMVEINIPPQNAPDLGERGWVVDESDQRFIFCNHVGYRQQVVAMFRGPFSLVDAIHDIDQLTRRWLVQGVRYHQVTMGIEELSFLIGEDVCQAVGVHDLSILTLVGDGKK